MDQWRGDGRLRHRAMFSLALLAHLALIGTMLRSRLSNYNRDEATTIEATIVLSSPVRPTHNAEASPPPTVRLSRLRSILHTSEDTHAIVAPVLEPQPITRTPSKPEPPASGAAVPLNLTLTRDQLRAVIAGTRPTQALSLARPAAPSALARIAGDDASYEEILLPSGVTEVHVHGGCFQLMPTARGQYDPFNHANERLTAPCH